MKEIDGYIQSSQASANLIAEALNQGPVMFSWTDGATQYEIYMIPSGSFRTWARAPEKIHRWIGYGNVIVGIERKGCFHFDLMSGTQEFSGQYVAEKLGLDRMAKDSGELADLFNYISAFFAKKGRNIVL